MECVELSDDVRLRVATTRGCGRVGLVSVRVSLGLVGGWVGHCAALLRKHYENI